MLIQRQNIPGRKQKIQPAKHRPVCEQPGDGVEDNATKMDQQLCA